MSLRRLDAELVARGIARSRADARELIDSGTVEVNGQVAKVVARQVKPDDSIRLTEAQQRWVSRGAHKLIGALDAFHVDVTDRVCLDAGASTGGFCEVLLDRGAARVHAVDVGYGQLAWRVQSDERVVVHDRTNVRTLDPGQIGEPISLVTADLSFISLRLVLPALFAVADESADLLLMVKPQFELGRQAVAGSGVVRDPQLRAQAVHDVAQAAAQLGRSSVQVVASPLPGPSGNVEYFLHLHGNGPSIGEDEINRAVEEGPQ